MNGTQRAGAAALVALGLMFASACNGSSKPSAAAPSSSSPPAVAVAATSAVASPTTSAPPAAATTPVAAPTSAPSPAVASSAPASSAPTSAAPATSAPVTAPTSAAAPPVAGGGKCTDLTSAAASAALGKATTVKADATISPLPGLSICNVTIANEVYPVQLAVDTSNAAQLYAADLSVTGPGKPISGVGEKAFSSQIGVEALGKGADIKVTGPAGPVLNGNFTVPTALAKAMVAALK